MSKSVLICAPKYGGCGLVGDADCFPWAGTTENPIDDIVQCRDCGQDHMFQLTDENFNSLTEELNAIDKIKARVMFGSRA